MPSKDPNSVRRAYSLWAESYDSDENRTRDLDQLVTSTVLGKLQCHTVLELGCGTGKNTPLFAQIGKRVIGIDFSERMIRAARAKTEALASISLLIGDATSRWPVATGSIDLVSINLVLEHIVRLDHVFEEAARILKPHGRLFICELHPFRQYEGAKARFQQGAARTIEIPATVHHLSEFIEQSAPHGFSLEQLHEWWHRDDDLHRAPRLVSFLFVTLQNQASS